MADKKVVNKGDIETSDGQLQFKTILLNKATGNSSPLLSLNLDPFASDYNSSNSVISPPYDPLVLAKMAEVSPVLDTCIRAMQTNITGFGYDFELIKGIESEDKMPPEAKEELSRLQKFFRYVNRKQDFLTLSNELIRDEESTGDSYIEVIRNRSGRIAELHRLPSHTMRITARSKEWVTYEQSIRDEEGNYETITRNERFRLFVQRADGGKKVYFKEFGDPRVISSANGKEVKASAVPANEVIRFSISTSYTTYGLPRWISTWIGILGTRKADTVNYLFFDNKCVPPLVVTVSGGNLTGNTVDKLKDLFEKEIKGMDNFHNAIILEAVPSQTGTFAGEKVSPVKIEVKPLTQFIESDAQFLKYKESNDNELQATFRISPIYRGLVHEYNLATAQTAVKFCEEQVFIPERRRIEYIYQTTILSAMEIKYFNFKLKGAKTSDFAEILTAISGVKEAIPLGTIEKVVNMMLNEPAEDIPEELFRTYISQLNQQIEVDPDAPGTPKKKEESVIKSLIDMRDKLQDHLKSRKEPT